MRRRVERLAPGQPVWVGTFHRFCARLLRKYAPLVGLEENYTIYDTGDSLAGPAAGHRPAEDRRRARFTPERSPGPSVGPRTT